MILIRLKVNYYMMFSFPDIFSVADTFSSGVSYVGYPNTEAQESSQTVYSSSVVAQEFGCETCGKRFRKRYDLQRHNMIHTGIKPFSCRICKRSFRQKPHLKSHMMIHHSDEFLANP